MVSRARFVRRVIPGVAVKIGASASGSVASTVAGPVAGAAGAEVTERLLHWTIGRFSDVYREG